MLIKPSPAINKYTLDSSEGVNNLQIATSAREIVSVVVTAGSADIVVGIYDSANGGTDKKSALFIGANQGESMTFCPSQPILYKKGIYVQIEQGGAPFNGKVFLSTN